MVGVTGGLLARRQTIIYGVKRGKIPAVLRPNLLPEKKEAGKPSCLDEMSRLFNCWSDSSFQDSICNKEIESFLLCANQSITNYHQSGKGKKTQWNITKINELLAKHTVVTKRGMNDKSKPLNKLIMK